MVRPLVPLWGAMWITDFCLGKSRGGVSLERWKVTCMFFFLSLLNLVFSFLYKIPTLKRRRVYVNMICIVYVLYMYLKTGGQRVSELNSKRGVFTTFSTNDLCRCQVRQVGGWTFVPSLYLDSWRWDGGLLGQQSGLWTVSWSAMLVGGFGGFEEVVIWKF